MDDRQHQAECLDRWRRLKAEAERKYRLYRAKNITRQELEKWLKDRSTMDERTLRAMFRRMQGK